MKVLIPVVLALILLVSCATVNPYTDENPYVANIGQDGDYVFTTTRNVLNIKNVSVSRISGAYNPQTAIFYGALEGSFSRALFNSAMKISKSIEKAERGTIRAWYDKENKIYYYCPANGIVLFANEGIEDVYLSTFASAKPFVDTYSLFKMVGSEIGFYVKHPSVVPDIGFNIPEATVSRFDSVCASIDGEILNVDFNFTSDEFASAFSTIIKASVIGKMILAGEKPDLNALKNQIRKENNSVYLTDINLPEEEQNLVINKIIKGK